MLILILGLLIVICQSQVITVYHLPVGNKVWKCHMELDVENTKSATSNSCLYKQKHEWHHGIITRENRCQNLSQYIQSYKLPQIYDYKSYKDYRIINYNLTVANDNTTNKSEHIYQFEIINVDRKGCNLEGDLKTDPEQSEKEIPDLTITHYYPQDFREHQCGLLVKPESEYCDYQVAQISKSEKRTCEFIGQQVLDGQVVLLKDWFKRELQYQISYDDETKLYRIQNQDGECPEFQFKGHLEIQQNQQIII